MKTIFRLTLTTLATVGSRVTVQSVHTKKTLPAVMVLNFPRREKAAAKVGPRLDISPIEIPAVLKSAHGLSSLLSNAESWEPFAWKGNDLSAPLRALFAAEARGLLANPSRPIAIADIAADVNGYLLSFGKKPASENALLNNLKQAALFLNAAVGVTIIPDRQSMTVRLVTEFETNENIEKYFTQIQSRLQKLAAQVQHAEACGYDVSRTLSPAQSEAAKQLVGA